MLLFPSREETSAKKLKQMVPHLIICYQQAFIANCSIQPIPISRQLPTKITTMYFQFTLYIIPSSFLKSNKNDVGRRQGVYITKRRYISNKSSMPSQNGILYQKVNNTSISSSKYSGLNNQDPLFIS
jgi:hypothetical protein